MARRLLSESGRQVIAEEGFWEQGDGDDWETVQKVKNPNKKTKAKPEGVPKENHRKQNDDQKNTK